MIETALGATLSQSIFSKDKENDCKGKDCKGKANEVAHEFGVEERHRQFQQLDEEVAHQRDVDPHGDMQQQPPADEADALVLDAHVDDGLGEERQDKLQQTAQNHA